jgi:hypothetical protein
MYDNLGVVEHHHDVTLYVVLTPVEVAVRHIVRIRTILAGEWPIQPQLTTGPTCICPRDVPDVWCDNNHHARQAMDRELGLLQPPPLPPVPPCTCTYRVWTTRIVLPAIQRTRVRPRAYQVVSGTGFTINPRCEHHGDLRRIEYFDATYTEPDGGVL